MHQALQKALMLPVPVAAFVWLLAHGLQHSRTTPNHCHHPRWCSRCTSSSPCMPCQNKEEQDQCLSKDIFTCPWFEGPWTHFGIPHTVLDCAPMISSCLHLIDKASFLVRLAHWLVHQEGQPQVSCTLRPREVHCWSARTIDRWSAGNVLLFSARPASPHAVEGVQGPKQRWTDPQFHCMSNFFAQL